MAVYRGKSSMYEYVTAGLVTGGTYKFNMGLKGMAAGAIVGGGLGAIAGGLSLLILKSTGMTMEEVRYWQYKWRSSRDDAINDSYRETFKNSDRNDELYEEHDAKARVGSNLDLKTAIADEWKAAKAVMPQEPEAVEKK
jgi:complex I assembly factor TIMMDC1